MNSSPSQTAPSGADGRLDRPLDRPLDQVVVLLVDDQLIIGEAVRRILAAEPNIEFHFCQAGADALAKAAELQPTVILQDLVMPDADGLDLVRGYRAQEATRLTPLIVLSSREEGTTKAEAFARGANDYVVKLPDPMELVARLRYHSRGYLSLLQRNAAFDALERSEAALAAELAKAAEYVSSILPAPMTEPIAIDWRFVPSASLGGDCLDYFRIDDDHIAIHVLDVCGHGVGPALLGVSALNAIRGAGGGGADPRDPSSVLARLNALFPMARHGMMYFTIWYGVYRVSTRTLSYTGGGHPPGLLVGPPNVPNAANASSGSAGIRQLDCPGMPVGIDGDQPCETITIEIAPDSSLLLYSDGAFEVFDQHRNMWGMDGLLDFVASRQSLGSGLDARSLDELYTTLQTLEGSDALGDDFSAMLVRFG